MFPRKHRLSSPGATFVIRRGFQVAGPSLRIKWIPSRSAVSRVTVVAGLSVDKRAVKRNLVKRRLREALRPLVSQLNPPVNPAPLLPSGAKRQEGITTQPSSAKLQGFSSYRGSLKIEGQQRRGINLMVFAHKNALGRSMRELHEELTVLLKRARLLH